MAFDIIIKIIHAIVLDAAAYSPFVFFRPNPITSNCSQKEEIPIYRVTLILFVVCGGMIWILFGAPSDVGSENTIINQFQLEELAIINIYSIYATSSVTVIAYSNLF